MSARKSGRHRAGITAAPSEHGLENGSVAGRSRALFGRLTDNPGALPAAAIVLVFAILIAWRLGPSLLGFRVFAATGLVGRWTPWFDGVPTAQVKFPIVGDTLDFFLPAYIEIRDRIFSGDLPWWSSLAGPGAPLMATTDVPTLNPAAVWLVALPTSWAIGFVKFIQLVSAFAGLTFWLRRLGTGWAAGLLAGLAYCGSGFFVSWGNWVPQATAAAFIPALFWAVERFIQLRTLRGGLPLAAMVAFMLLAGFPAVAGHALYAAAAYFLVRLIADLRESSWRTTAIAFGAGAAAVVLGVALSAVQFLPLISRLATTDLDYRDAQFASVMPFRSMLSMVLPRVFNTAGYGGSNPIEAYAFVGGGTVVLAVVAIFCPRLVDVRRGVVGFLTVGLIFAGLLGFKHGWWTDWLRDVPVFKQNPSRRLRDLVCFFFCALGGLGANAVFRTQAGRSRRRLLITVGATAAVLTAACVLIAAELDSKVNRGYLYQDLAIGGATVGCVLAVVLAGGYARPLGRLSVLALVVLVGVQVALSVNYFWPTGTKDDFYPQNELIAAADADSTDGRVLPLGAFPGSTGQAVSLRTLTSHNFQPVEWKQLMLALDGKAYITPTYSRMSFGLADEKVHSPLLDRAAVCTIVVSSGARIPGVARTIDGTPAGSATAPHGAPLHLADGSSTTVKLAAQPLRAVAVYLPDGAGDGSTANTLSIAIRGSNSEVLATGTFTRGRIAHGWLTIPVAGESLGALAEQPLTLQVTVVDTEGGVDLGTNEEGDLAVRVTAPIDDGLTEVKADVHGSVWHRSSALPRLRWASAAEVLTDPADRLARLKNPELSASTVVLSADGPEPGGGTAQLENVQDTGDDVGATVQADTSGYLVLADSVLGDWIAHIDDEKAPLVAADHAFVAVFVPAGTHRITFGMDTGTVKVGAWISSFALVIWLAVLVLTAPAVLRRLRDRRGDTVTQVSE